GSTIDQSAPNIVYSTFSGQSVSLNDTLVKYTWFGDANLDGVIDSTDYNLIDSGFSHPGSSGWINGDFDYSGSINSTDYFLIDAAFLSEGSTLLAPAAPVPEPSIGIVLSAALVSRRRKRRRTSTAPPPPAGARSR